MKATQSKTIKRYLIATLLSCCAFLFIACGGTPPAVPVSGSGLVPDSIKVISIKASSNDGNLPQNTIDGRLDTRWSAQGDGEWIEFTFEQATMVGYVGIATNKGKERKTKFEVQLSNDGVVWKSLLTASTSGTTDDMEAFDFVDTEARWARIVGFGNSANKWTSLTEVEWYRPHAKGLVMAPPTPKPVPTPSPSIARFIKPGFFDQAGKPYTPHTPHPVTGKTLNVTSFGANPADTADDDTQAIQNAIDAAQPGDEVYLPAGVYNLNTTALTDRTSHLLLKSGVNLRGEGMDKVVLRSNFDSAANRTTSTRTLRLLGLSEILMSGFTLSAVYDGRYSSDPTRNSPAAGGPRYHIFIESINQTPSRLITVDQVRLENFQRMAIRISKSREVIVRRCDFHKATDVGGGGAGYGVSIQGAGHDVDLLGSELDCYFNLVEDCTFRGPYIRHGILFQYYAHNSVARRNILTGMRYDAIDLHGEDEYLNEVYENTISDVLDGAAIGLGNSAAGHDAAGPDNVIRDNIITNCREGITLILGSPRTLVQGNVISDTGLPGAKGIVVRNAPGTIIVGNRIIDNTGAGFTGIELAHDGGEEGRYIGPPENVRIEGNIITGNDIGLRLSAGKNIVVRGNTIMGNRNDIQSSIQATIEP